MRRMSASIGEGTMYYRCYDRHSAWTGVCMGLLVLRRSLAGITTDVCVYIQLRTTGVIQSFQTHSLSAPGMLS